MARKLLIVLLCDSADRKSTIENNIKDDLCR